MAHEASAKVNGWLIYGDNYTLEIIRNWAGWEGRPYMIWGQNQTGSLELLNVVADRLSDVIAVTYRGGAGTVTVGQINRLVGNCYLQIEIPPAWFV